MGNQGGRPAREGGPDRVRSFRIPGALYQQVTEVAAARGDTITAAVIWGLTKYVRTHRSRTAADS